MRQPVIGALLAVAGTILFAASAIAVLASPQPDARALECGADVPGNIVAAAIDIPSGRAFWDHFPAAAAAPELENNLPAHVVVFGGEYTLFRTGQVYEHVVCVVQGDSTYLYPDVDLTNADLRP